MADSDTGNQNANQRVCDRLTVHRKILFELDNGEILTGNTEDISPRGVLMNTESPPGSDLINLTGTLFIISDDGQFSIGYPCKVVRLIGKSIALEIEKKAAAAFGNHMAKELLLGR